MEDVGGTEGGGGGGGPEGTNDALDLRDVGGMGRAFAGIETSDEGRGPGFGGGLLSAAIDGSEGVGDDSVD